MRLDAIASHDVFVGDHFVATQAVLSFVETLVVISLQTFDECLRECQILLVHVILSKKVRHRVFALRKVNVQKGVFCAQFRVLVRDLVVHMIENLNVLLERMQERIQLRSDIRQFIFDLTSVAQEVAVRGYDGSSKIDDASRCARSNRNRRSRERGQTGTAFRSTSITTGRRHSTTASKKKSVDHAVFRKHSGQFRAAGVCQSYRWIHRFAPNFSPRTTGFAS